MPVSSSPQALPIGRYVGFALLLAWHYGFWFVPGMFLFTPLLDDQVTIAWLVNLFATGFALLLLATLLGRKRHLCERRVLVRVIPPLMTLLSLLMCLYVFTFDLLAIACAIAAVLGVCEAILWILWGEFFASQRDILQISGIGTVAGLTLILVLAIAWVLPPFVKSLFVCPLSLASGIFLLQKEKRSTANFPTLLPLNIASDKLHNITIVSVISLIASLTCYYLVCIIPWETLPLTDVSFTVGIMLAASTIFITGVATYFAKSQNSVFRIYPFMLVVEIGAFALFLTGNEALLFPAFVIGLGVYALFEIMLIVYFDTLLVKGYVPPAAAFAFAGAFIRIGTALGDGLALTYERMPDISPSVVSNTSLLFVCLLAVLLIPLIRQEYKILSITNPKASKDEIEDVCNEVGNEFRLSKRELEIMILIARGYTTQNIARTLVISTHTVNTHIRHIYEKLSIHNRSELQEYLNLR